jgi:murein DD-endopeptidase MepM/ murein hydrolase activator NlpD
VDIYFEDKQFPALAQGKVVDIGNEPGGYGLYVVTEHRDPVTGDTFQLMNAHMDRINVKIGQSVSPGAILGKQGSTGRTSAGGIASIDPLEPAPRGSKSTTPYRRKQVLKELLAASGIK